MRAIVYVILSVLGLSAATFAEAPKSDDLNAAELKTLQGRWKIVKAFENGQEIPTDGPETQRMKLNISDSVVEVMIGGKVVQRDRLYLNPSASPKEIDLQAVNEKGQPLKIKRVKPGAKKGEVPQAIDEVEVERKLGIYELTGDKLKLCVPDSGDRPNKFNDKRNARVLVLELERLKK